MDFKVATCGAFVFYKEHLAVFNRIQNISGNSIANAFCEDSRDKINFTHNSDF